LFDYLGECPELLDFVGFGVGADHSLSVNVANDEAVLHVATCRAKNWRARGSLCRAEAGSDSVKAVGRDKVLTFDVQTAVDRYREAWEGATSHLDAGLAR